MKEKLTRNWGLKLISLLCAFFVWLAVVNVANPVQTKTREVPVNVINEGILEQSNLTYEIVGKKTAVISFQVKTKDNYKIKPSDFRAYADLSEMYQVTGAIPIKVEVVNNEDLIKDVAVKSPEVLRVQTEKLQTKRFKLIAKTDGTPEDGYVPGDAVITPDSIDIKGAESTIGHITSVGIVIDVDGADSDVSGTGKPVFFDALGNKLDIGSSVRVLGGDISYSQQILKVKPLPLDFVVTGEVAPGYRYTGPECSLKEVPVAGLKSALASLNTFTIQSPDLNIDGATKDKMVTIDLKQFLPPNIRIAGLNDTTIKVTLKVEPLEDRTYSVDTDNIKLTGTSDQYSYHIVADTVQLKIRGLKEDLDTLTPDKMNLTVDMTGEGPGTYQRTIGLVLDNAYQIEDNPGCQVEVEEKTAVSASATASADADDKETDGADKNGKNTETKQETKAETKQENKSETKIAGTAAGKSENKAAATTAVKAGE